MAAQDLSPRAARAYVTHLAKTVLRHEPKNVRRRGGGLTNFVYQVDIADQSLIARINADPRKLQTFKREQQGMNLARDAGLPVPQVLHVGADPHPFMVLDNVRGAVGTHAYDRTATVRQMGELTARIHQIRTQGFGPTALDAAPLRGTRRHSWGAHLEGDLHASERLAALERLGMLLPVNAETMRRTLAYMCTWRHNPVLHHGDMRLKNVIVDHEGKIVAVLDWENCTSSVPALWDLSIALHDLTIDEKQAFLQGYGYGPRELTKSIAYIRLLNTLNYAPVVEAMVERGEKSKLHWHRVRIAGDFNLYR